jgi:hypothetical protein
MLITSISLLLTFPYGADARLFPEITPNCDQNLIIVNGIPTIPSEQRCDLDNFVTLFINLFDWGLAVLSIVSIVFFIIGGAYLLISAGNEQRVQTGKSILVNTSLGIGVALGSWLIINTVVGLLVGNGTFTDVKVFGKNWWGVNSCTSEFNQVCQQYNLSYGCGDASSSYVSELQRKLRDAGCFEGTLNGCFGNDTADAVTKFNQANGIALEDAANRETWDALNSGKTCSTGAQAAQIASGTGCCVTQCGTGIANTLEQNGANGCKDLYTNAVWYNGACSADALSASIGCCEQLDNTCDEQVNVDWCKRSIVNGQGGIFVLGTCPAARCPAGISTPCL